MKIHLRWWDGLALLASAAAAVLIVQYVLSRSGLDKPVGSALRLSGPVEVELRIPRPLPEILEQIVPADPVQDEAGMVLGRVLAKRTVAAAGQYAFGRLAGEQDAIVTLRLDKELPPIRDFPGLPRSLSGMKPGVWCVLITPRVEVIGLVVKQAAGAGQPRP